MYMEDQGSVIMPHTQRVSLTSSGKKKPNKKTAQMDTV